MSLLKIIYTTALLFIVSLAGAQVDNVFLDRDYWKANPSTASIDENIKAGHDVAQLNGSAFDAVAYALLEKVDHETIQYLLSQPGNDANKLTHDARTYIFWAAYKGNVAMMKHLLLKGAKTDIIDSHGNSVMTFAAGSGQMNTEVYDLCIAHSTDVQKETNLNGANALLLLAPFLEDMDMVDYFTNKGMDIDSKDSNGNGIFNYAVKGGNIAFMNKLIAAGVEYKPLNNLNENAMIAASRSRRGHSNTLEVYQYLADKGINPNITSSKGVTPLHSIAYNVKDLALYQYFIDAGVDINQANAIGHTVLMNAAYRNEVSVIKYLVPYVKDINAVNDDGQSALLLAIRRNNIEVINYLIEQGAEVKLSDGEGNNLAYYVLNTFNADKPDDFENKLAVLTTAGLDFTKQQSDGNNLFHLAAKKNNLALLKRVSLLDLDINLKNAEGNTPLHIAAMRSENDSILKFLIANGADTSITTEFDESAFDLASENELLQKHNTALAFLK